MEFKTIITKIGKAKFANAATLGQKIDFKYMALGDGGGKYPDITEEQNKLANEVYRGQINNVSIDENNANWIKISIIIPPNVGGFFVREIGIFDIEEDLIAIGTYPETYKPTFEEGSSKDLVANMILEIANASIVTLKVDPTVILATKKDVDEVRQKVQSKTEIIVSKSPPIPADREKGAFYFIVTDENEIPISPAENIKVSPNMGIKIKEG